MDDTFDIQDKLFDIFKNDAELCELLGIHDINDPGTLNLKLRREDIMPELFDGNTLDFIAFFFADVDISRNYLVNRGLLRLDIYSRFRDGAGKIRKRCVDLIHGLDVRIVSERQISSDITNVYKYRLEILPLVSS